MRPEQGRAEQIAAFLRTNLRPGDIVQPLDWLNGAEHGMLMAPGTSDTFQEVDALIAQQYHRRVARGNGFVIDERNAAR